MHISSVSGLAQVLQAWLVSTGFATNVFSIIFSIVWCSNIKITTSSYSNSLSTLIIVGFLDIVEFDWSVLSSLSSLQNLELRNRPNLVSLPDQLQHLTALRELKLSGLSIESLPDWFGKLYLLKCYHWKIVGSFSTCRQWQPWKVTKLSWLTITCCRQLIGRFPEWTDEIPLLLKLTDPEWTKISRIPNVIISFMLIKSGKVVNTRWFTSLFFIITVAIRYLITVAIGYLYFGMYKLHI